MPVGCVRVSPNRSRIFFIIGRCSRSLGGEGGGTDWQRVGGFDSWPLDWMWMLLLPSLLSWLFVCPFPQVPISSTMLQKEAVRVDARSCVVVYIFRSVYTILPYVCASASSTYICGTVDRVSLRSRSFYWVWTAEKRFSCFYIEAIFPSRPVAFKNTDFDVPRSLAVWLLFLLLSLFSEFLPYALSFGSIGFINRYPFVLYATRNSKGRLKSTSTIRLPSQVLWVTEWMRLELMLDNI